MAEWIDHGKSMLNRCRYTDGWIVDLMTDGCCDGWIFWKDGFGRLDGLKRKEERDRKGDVVKCFDILRGN